MNILLNSNLKSLKLLARGKVRDNYEVSKNEILMVATDRLSAFDVIMNEAIPNKGKLLTQISLFWFKKLQKICPNHLTNKNPENVVLSEEINQIKDRSMLVKKLKPLPIEAVIRGYLVGSGFKEYQKNKSICGIKLPENLKNASKLPEIIFTPATKAEIGNHDENISYEKCEQIIGKDLTKKIKEISINLYREASDFAFKKGIIIADTKFEFGLDESDNLILMDEVLTPDSSRYWPIKDYQTAFEKNKNPPSFDKQFIRDYLETIRINNKFWNKKSPAPNLPEDIINITTEKYQEIVNILMN